MQFPCLRSVASAFKKPKVFVWIIAFCWLACTAPNDPPPKHANGVFFDTVFLSSTQRADEKLFASPKKYLEAAIAKKSALSVHDSLQYYYLLYNESLKINNDLEAATHFADTMLLIVQRHETDAWLADQHAEALFLKGDVEYKLGNYEAAYQLYYKGKEKGKASPNSCIMGGYEYRIGMVLYRQQNFEDAAWYFKQAMQSLSPCDEVFTYTYRIQELYNNIGLCFFNSGAMDSAKFYYQRGLNYLSEKEKSRTWEQMDLMQVARAVIKGNMASAFAAEKNYGKAENLLNESISIQRKYRKELDDALISTLKLAEIYHLTGKPEAMKNTLDEVHNAIQKTPDAQVESGWNAMMALFYETSNPSLALQYLTAHQRLEDSINASYHTLNSLNIKSRLSDMEARYNLNAMQRDRETERKFLFIAIGFAVAGLCVVVFVVYNLRRTRRYMRILQSLNHRVSKQKHTLEETAKKLEDSHREKDKIMRVVAHDLRSPAGAIHAISELMLRDAALNEEQLEQLGMIKSASQHSLTLSKEILEATAILQDKTLKKEPTDLNELLTRQTGILKFRAAEKEQTIKLELPPKPLVAMVDAEKVSRVIANLVTNAIKFSNAGSEIEITLSEDANHALIAITDKGIGIPEKIKDQIFDLFTEAKRYGTTGEKPFGMGLAISRQIMEAHIGRIWFKSVENAGTTFFVSLPAGMEV